MPSKKLLLIAALIALALGLIVLEVRYITTQSLLAPTTVELRSVVYGGLGSRFAPFDCLVAGRQTGWKGYRGYLGFILVDKRKSDVLLQDGNLAVGNEVLKNCHSVKELLTDGKNYQEMEILNRFGKSGTRPNLTNKTTALLPSSAKVDADKMPYNLLQVMDRTPGTISQTPYFFRILSNIG